MHGTLTGSTMRSVITVFIITAFVTHSVQAYSRIVFHTLEALAYARIDPIIAPGKISQQCVVLLMNQNAVYALNLPSSYYSQCAPHCWSFWIWQDL
jgi:hypothetical protein